MYGYIYKTINLINNKMYIGKHRATVFEPNRYIGSGPILMKAIKKYGKENFKCELIEWCETKQQLDEREQYWIAYFNCQQDSSYYNIAKGGEGGVGRDINNPNSYWNDPLKRQAAIEKSKISLKKYFSEHPEAHAGANNPNYGKKASEETRLKLSKKFKESEGVKNSKRFTGGHHSQETKEKLSAWGKRKRWINNGKISTYLLDNEPLPVGFTFGKLPSIETQTRKEKFKDLQLNSSTGKKKKVLCVELNKVFESASQASKLLNINPAQISSCCHGRINTAGGYHWEFVGEN